LIEVPPKPEAPRIEVNRNECSLSWIKYEQVTHFRLLFNERLVYEGNQHKFTLKDLEFNSKNIVQLISCNEAGESPPSDTIIVQLGPRPEWPKEFQFLKNMDTNGLFYWLGTNEGKNAQYQNPADIGKLIVTSSSHYAGIPNRAAGRDNSNYNMTKNEPNSWFQFEMKDFTMKPNYYTILPDRKVISHSLRNWRLEGSNDCQMWTTLKTHVNDQSIGDQGNGFWSASWPIEDVARFYKFFRVLQTGKNSSDYGYLTLSGLELYGTVQK